MFSCFFLFLLITVTSLGAEISPETRNALNTFIEEQVQADGLKGVAIAVVDLDGVVFQKCIGTAVEPDSSFVIGSLSKAITAVAVMQLVEKAKLELDRPVNHYLSGFNPTGVEGVVTVRHLLNQRSGFTRKEGFESPGEDGLVRSALQFTPGDHYSYSNLNYALLGKLIETVTQVSFSEYVRENVFERLGMKDASAETVFLPEENRLTGNRFFFWGSLPIDEPTPREGGVPSGFIRASVSDMALFLSAHLKNDSAKLGLSEEAIKWLHTPATGKTGYAMGWYATQYKGTHLLRHSGLSSSFTSSMALLPDHSLGVIVLANINSFTGADHLRDGIIKLLLGHPAVVTASKERWIRLGALGLLIVSLLQLLLTVFKWKRAGMPMRLSLRAKRVFPVFLSISIAAVVLILVPVWAKTPLSVLLSSQIDLGTVLVAGLSFGIVRSIIKQMIQTQKSESFSIGNCDDGVSL